MRPGKSTGDTIRNITGVIRRTHSKRDDNTINKHDIPTSSAPFCPLRSCWLLSVSPQGWLLILKWSLINNLGGRFVLSKHSPDTGCGTGKCNVTLQCFNFKLSFNTWTIATYNLCLTYCITWDWYIQQLSVCTVACTRPALLSLITV